MTPSSPVQRQFLLLFIVLFFAVTVQAQSGRRQSKPAPAAPVPTPTPEPTPTPKEGTKTDLGFIVTIDTTAIFEYYPLSYYTAVVNACADRLRKASSATVTTAQHMNRGDAIKKAKTEKTTYVVLLRLVSYSMGGSGQGRDQDIELEFNVFAPTTAKIATSGKSYQNATRKGPVIVQPPGGSTSSIVYREMLLKRAAEDAADRILRSLHQGGPNRLISTSFQPHRRAAQ
jgi:hypothetical protein